MAHDRIAGSFVALITPFNQDGSVMPFVPCANTNLPTLMIAEKMADAILAQ